MDAPDLATWLVDLASTPIGRTLVELVGVGLAFLLARWLIGLARAWFRSGSAPHWLGGPLAYQFLDVAAGSVLGALAYRLEGLNPKAMEGEVARAAREVYATLPDAVPVRVLGVRLLVPIKALVSEAMFVRFVLEVWHGVSHAEDDLHDEVDRAYAAWKRDHEKKPGPPSPQVTARTRESLKLRYPVKPRG